MPGLSPIARPLPWLLGLCFAFAVAGCKDDGEGAGSTDSGTSTGTAAEATSNGSFTSSPGSTGGFDDSGGDDDPMGECFLWEDECGSEQKCMPWSDSPDRIPDETRCCPVDANPSFIGEECTIAEYDGSCVDSCETGSMCVLDNPDALTGKCRKFCNPTAPECDSTQTCKAFFETLPLVPNIPLCMAKCDPVVQDCPESGWKCIPDSPTESGQSGFICVPEPPGTPNMLFDPCALANDCEAGLVCLTQDRVPGCTFQQCCSAYCSLSDGDATCQALHPDLACVDWMAPDPQWQDVGACAIPQ